MNLDKLVQLDGNRQELVRNLQEKYSRLAIEGKIFEIKRLVNHTTLHPKLSNEELTNLYMSSIGNPDTKYNLERIQEWDKETNQGEPLAFNNLGDEFTKVVEGGYFTAIKEHIDMDLKKIKEITGISITEEIVNKAFNQRIREGKTIDKYYFERVEEKTGITPIADKKVVQEFYKKLFKQERGQNSYFWEGLINVTGIIPEKETVQSAFKYFVRKKKLFWLVKFAELTGGIVEEKTVRRIHRFIVRSKQFNFASMCKDLKKISNGIIPEEKTVQLAYRKALKIPIFIHDFKNIKKVTDINPNENTLQEAYLKLIRHGDFEGYESLHDFFKLRPSEKVREGLVKYLFS